MDNSKISAQNEDSRAGYRILKAVRTVFIYVLAAVIIIAALMFAASNNPSKSLFGFRYYSVLTPSMEPAYSVGDMVFVKTGTADSIKVGDVITFNPSEYGDAYLTHRVVEVLPDYQGSGITCFRTKGDANDSEDSFLIDEDRVIGTVVFSIPKFGYIVRFVQLRWYFIVPIIALIFIFFKLIGIYLDLSNKKKKSKNAIEGDGEDSVKSSPELSQAGKDDSSGGGTGNDILSN